MNNNLLEVIFYEKKKTKTGKGQMFVCIYFVNGLKLSEKQQQLFYRLHKHIFGWQMLVDIHTVLYQQPSSSKLYGIINDIL